MTGKDISRYPTARQIKRSWLHRFNDPAPDLSPVDSQGKRYNRSARRAHGRRHTGKRAQPRKAQR